VSSPDHGPSTFPDFVRRFPDDAACLAFLATLRWPEGFACPKCGAPKGYLAPSRAHSYVCPEGHQVSLTAGTVMHRTKVPLTVWFYAAYLVATLTPGISAVQLQKQLGLSRYETAFQLLHKLRAGLVDPAREPLQGEVEVDEAYVGGVEEGRPGRGAETKSIVLVGVEVVPYEAKGKDGSPIVKLRAGRIRMSVVENLEAATLVPWVQKNVARGSRVLTDGNASYNQLGSLGFTHEKVFASHKKISTGQYLPLVHLIIVNLKTWLRGTHKGAVLPKHLPAYLNEFTFRFNRRYWRGPAFLRALGLSLAAPHGHVEYATLYSGTWQHPNPRRSGTEG
jgi:transposase-like protein